MKDKMKKKILTDLDVLTVAFWDKKKEALEFVERIRKGEFEVYMPYALLELIEKWKHNKLKDEIKHFYELYSKQIITIQNVFEESQQKGLDAEKAAKELLKEGVKGEDAALVLVVSLFELNYLVTYNRKHLLNMVEKINEVLKQNDFREIGIALPSAL